MSFRYFRLTYHVGNQSMRELNLHWMILDKTRWSERSAEPGPNPSQIWQTFACPPFHDKVQLSTDPFLLYLLSFSLIVPQSCNSYLTNWHSTTHCSLCSALSALWLTRILSIPPPTHRFVSSHNWLELLQYSHMSSSASLNRQFIRILEHLGVPKSVFMQMTKEHLNNLNQMTRLT